MIGISEQEILRRRDMRDVLTFTVDPADAQDFDDALSFVAQEDGTFQIGVHIADVTHYVRPGSREDDDAYQRGTTVYLVNEVFPMLPEHLCNDLCSLRPNEDKLCMSVVFTINASAQVVKHKICRSVIRSDYRLTYEQAQDIISIPKDDSNPLSIAIHAINLLARQLRAQRMADGALEIEQEETKFILDSHGFPTDIYFLKPTEANHLIEEFMLLANRTVATAVGTRPFVYRIHDKPDRDKMHDARHFERFLKKAYAARGERINPAVIDMLTVRAMAKAEYSTHNIGHYGLAFSHYTHFTSPIRRYPDIMVHRLVDKYILSGKSESIGPDELEKMCHHCSEMESMAQQSERDSVKEFQALWMTRHIGEELAGHIVGVHEYGLFVQLDESRCEGLVHEYSICRGDYFQFDEKHFRLIAANSGETYTLGDPVVVKVAKVDTEKHHIEFTLVR